MLLIKSQVVLTSYSGGHLLSGKAGGHKDKVRKAPRFLLKSGAKDCTAAKARQSRLLS